MGGGEMTGHKQIIALRTKGLRPATAFVCDYIGRFAEWEIAEGSIPSVYVGGDNPALADCRFLTGMQVHLHSDDPARAAAWMDRLLTDGAKHVIQLTEGEIYEWRQ